MCAGRARAPESPEALLKGQHLRSHAVIRWGSLTVPPGRRRYDRRQPVVPVKEYLRDVVVRWSRIRSGQRPDDGRYITHFIDTFSRAHL